MIQGTGSGAGKSLLVAALCRVFNNMGVSVAPFKGQNMALNSHITYEGCEIGRAQALQAEAARIEPAVDMNPVLLKASGEMGSQVIIHGKVHSNMTVKEYYAYKKTAWEAVKTSFDRLSKKYELIIIEGAGSPAEINLRDGDIVNMAVARYAKAPVILVGDIDIGGVFASLYGTVKLLGKDSRYIKAFIINKFRGDIDILKPGLEMITGKTKKPVIGVLPYIHDIGLPEEDGLAIHRHSASRSKQSSAETIKIVVVRLRYISNFTDFDPFYCEPGVELIYSANPDDIESADMVIIPGSKNTTKDLLFLKESQLDKSILRAFAKGVQIIGICGGYQMLGRKIYDPYSVESPYKETDGLGILNIDTTFEQTKATYQVEAEIMENFKQGFSLQPSLKGYEIHMGSTTGDIGLFRVKRACQPSAFSLQPSEILLDGSINKNCWGTYIHGIFENDSFRGGLLNQLREQKKIPLKGPAIKYSETKELALNRLAKAFSDNIDMAFIKKAAGIC